MGGDGKVSSGSQLMMASDSIWRVAPLSAHFSSDAHKRTSIPLPDQGKVRVIPVAGIAVLAIAMSGTATAGYRADAQIIDIAARQTMISPALSARDNRRRLSIPLTLAGIRKATGLTWDQLAEAMAVSRRALHHWSSGGNITAENESRLRGLFTLVAKFKNSRQAAYEAVVERYGITTSRQKTDGADCRSPIRAAILEAEELVVKRPSPKPIALNLRRNG
jgi:DNA-binding transcriptional regulator YiaG